MRMEEEQRQDNNYEHMLMIASPDGRCYLFDKRSGLIKWFVETTNGALYLVIRPDEVKDYLDLKPEKDPDGIHWLDNNTDFYHFKPDTQPQLQPLETRAEIIQYLDPYYSDPHTTVNQTEHVYHFDYASGNPVNSSLASFKIQTREFYISRPYWSLKVVRIRAWFPAYFSDECTREKCEVFHSRNSQKYIQVCYKFNLNPLLPDSFLNRFILENKNMSDLVTVNRKIQLPEIDNKVTEGKHDISILRGTFDGHNAIVKKVKRKGGLEYTKRMKRMIQMSGYHENLVNFYRWETDREFDYFAFEDCGVTLHEYVEQNSYEEMSETALKIMSGLAEGVKHLHARGVAHLNLNPHNILVNSDNTIKICGLGNSKPLVEVKDGQLRDLHNLAHIILYIISDGKHDIEDVDVVAEAFEYRIVDTAYISGLHLVGTNEEALDLFKKLGIMSGSENSRIQSSENLKMHPHFLSSHDRLGFLEDISDHLNEGNPTPKLLTDLENLRSVVLASVRWFLHPLMVIGAKYYP